MTTVHELSPRTPVLSLQDVVIAYQEAHQPAQRVVHGVSFDVWPGEVVALVGESGSGKTTTAQSVIGLLAETAGSNPAASCSTAPTSRTGTTAASTASGARS